MGWKLPTARRGPALLRVGAGLLALIVWAGPSAGATRGPTAKSDRPPAVGTVSGTVHLQAVSASRPTMLSPYARPRYRPPARAEGSASSPESVVV